MLLSLTSIAGRTSRVLLADVILWINIASLALYIVSSSLYALGIMRAACHATSDLKFGSCIALSSSSPAIEASKPVAVEAISMSRRRHRYSY